MLKTACQESRRRGRTHVKVAVNLSPSQLKSRNLVQVVISALADPGMAANRLQLEITESVLMHNTFATLATLHELRKLGVQIAMDDFGTGYSSLSYLRSFPFDKIKIDRSFIQDLSNGAEPLAIVHAVAGLASASTWSRPPKASRRSSSWKRCRPSAAPRCRAICSARRSRPPISSRISCSPA